MAGERHGHDMLCVNRPNRLRPLWHFLKHGFIKQQGHLCFQKQVEQYVASFAFPYLQELFTAYTINTILCFTKQKMKVFLVSEKLTA